MIICIVILIYFYECECLSIEFDYDKYMFGSIFMEINVELTDFDEVRAKNDENSLTKQKRIQNDLKLVQVLERDSSSVTQFPNKGNVFVSRIYCWPKTCMNH